MLTNSNNDRRWAVVRRSTGTTVRKFSSRENARDYKRYNGGNLAILDTRTQEFVR